jgi:hypothetical protein
MENSVHSDHEIHTRSEVVRSDVYRGVFDVIGTTDLTRGKGIKDQVTKATYPDRALAEDAAITEAALWVQANWRKH